MMDTVLTALPTVPMNDLRVSLEHGVAYRDSQVQRTARFYHKASWDQIGAVRSQLLRRHDRVLNIGWFIPEHPTPMLYFDWDPTRVALYQERQVFADPFEAIPPGIHAVAIWDSLDTLLRPTELLKRVRPGTALYLSLPVFDLLNIESSPLRDPGRVYYFSESGLVKYLNSLGFPLCEVHQEEPLGLPGGRTFVFQK